MEALIQQLEQNLKELYRKALDADQLLAEIKQQGHGNFRQIFTADDLFQTKSDQFMPYLTETADLIYAIKQTGQFNTATLQKIVQQLQALHQTLADLQAALQR